MERLVQLEFALIPALGFEGERCLVTLNRAVMTDAKVFTDLICLMFKPHNRERDEPLPENMKNAAESAWQLLHRCRTHPGPRPDGSLDPSAFVKFIDGARLLCEQED